MIDKAQRTLRELTEIGAQVIQKGAVYDITYRDEHIRTTDPATVNVQLLIGMQPNISRQGARRQSGRDA